MCLSSPLYPVAPEGRLTLYTLTVSPVTMTVVFSCLQHLAWLGTHTLAVPQHHPDVCESDSAHETHIAHYTSTFLLQYVTWKSFGQCREGWGNELHTLSHTSSVSSTVPHGCSSDAVPAAHDLWGQVLWSPAAPLL